LRIAVPPGTDRLRTVVDGFVYGRIGSMARWNLSADPAAPRQPTWVTELQGCLLWTARAARETSDE